MKRPSKGFTLVELMIALTIGLVLLLAVGTAYQALQRLSLTRDAVSIRVSAMQDLSNLLQKEMRRAGYNTSSPGDGLVAMADGIQVQYRRPGVPLTDPPETRFYLFDQDSGTIIGSVDGGDEFPLHPVGLVSDVEVECAPVGSTAFAACGGGTAATSVRWEITFTADAAAGLPERSFTFVGTSRNRP